MKTRCGWPAKLDVMGDMTVETRPPLNLYGENFFS